VNKFQHILLFNLVHEALPVEEEANPNNHSLSKGNTMAVPKVRVQQAANYEKHSESADEAAGMWSRRCLIDGSEPSTWGVAAMSCWVPPH